MPAIALVLGIGGLIVAGIQSLSVLLNKTEESSGLEDLIALGLLAIGGYVIYKKI